MKLLYSPASPFARKARVLLRETNQLGVVEEVAVSTTPHDTAPEVAAANPTGRIPVLLREEGPALYDSRVITRFLDARAKAGLYPEARLWEVLTLEATADGITDSALSMVYEVLFRPEAQQSPEWIAAQWAKVTRGLQVLDDRWMSHLHGPLDMGQIALACALGYLDLRHEARKWRQGNDMLAAWYGRFSERQAMVETRPV